MRKGGLSATLFCFALPLLDLAGQDYSLKPRLHPGLDLPWPQPVLRAHRAVHLSLPERLFWSLM